MPQKGNEPGRTRKTLISPAPALTGGAGPQTLSRLVNLSVGLGLQLSLQVPAQTPTTTREKMISSKALATLLTPIKMAGTMAKMLLISRVPFLQGQQSPEGRGLRRQKLS